MGSIPDEDIDFLQFIKYFQSHYGPGFDLISNRNEYQESPWGRGVKRCRGVRHNLTATCEPTV
jgi:hypothetical protein